MFTPETPGVLDGADATAAFSLHATIHALFEEQAVRAPDNCAVECDGVCTTYRELNALAETVCEALLDAGMTLEDRVLVCTDSSALLIGGLYGILKSGAAYVPVDPDSPPARLAYLIRDSGAKFALTTRRYLDKIPPGLPRLLLEDVVGAAPRPASRPRCRRPLVDPQNLAYVIYTSGSTGEPKGVLVAHRSVANHNRAIARLLKLGPGDRMLHFTPVNFDAAGEEIYPPLISGGRVVVQRETLDPPQFSKLILQSSASILSLPPAFMRQWITYHRSHGGKLPDSLRAVLLGGETLLPELYDAWVSIGGLRVPWFNVYGPTECTITSAICEISSAGLRLTSPVLPVGLPIDNVRIYCLNATLNPVPSHQVGEVWIAGAGVARAYLGRPDLTAERFLPDPFFGRGERMYRTGDLGRSLPDGSLEILGRVDQQIKIHGHRIELGEIEAVLRKHPSVGEALVEARHEPGGNVRLVAYVVTGAKSSLLPVELRAFLAAKLPEYMLPAAYVRLDALPLTSASKVDRAALPSPGREDFPTSQHVEEPTDDVEARLSLLFAAVLEVPSVGNSDDFFQMGGQSLTAMTLADRIAESFGCEIMMTDVFDRPTVGALAEHIRALQAVATNQPSTAPAGELELDQQLEELVKKSQ